MERANEAIKAYSDALNVRPDSMEAYKQLGVIYDRTGKFLDALKMFMKAIRLDPNDIDLRNDLGMTYFNIGSYTESIKAYRQALELDPQNDRAHYSLGLVYLDINDKNSAFAEHQVLQDLGHKDLAKQLAEKIEAEFPSPAQ